MSRSLTILLSFGLAALAPHPTAQDAPPAPEVKISGSTIPADDIDRASAIELPELELADLGQWRVFARPSVSERNFDSLDWSPDLVSGLVRAGVERKPLLLWLMNGHPLACT